MTARRITWFLEIVAATLAPTLARADNLGAARVPPQVETVGNAGSDSNADLSNPDSEPGGKPSTSALKPGESRTLGGDNKDPGARRIENTANGLAAPGGVLGLDSMTAGADKKDEIISNQPSSVPELHVVQTGDTLWSLCSKYYNDPWRWPRLWAMNPSVTNPHWIFPGDVIRIGEGSGTGPVAPQPAAAATTPARPGMTSVNRLGAIISNAVLLREMGFIEARDLEQAATITGSREEKIMLSTSDQAYLQYPRTLPLRAGERYTVFSTDTDHPVVDSTTGKTYGYLVQIQSDIVVNQIAENDVARGVLVDTVRPVERGARVSPFVRQFKRVEPRPSEVNLEARVIATFEPNSLLGAGHFVVLNRGKRDGVQVGNRTFVVRRGDGYRRALEDVCYARPQFPEGSRG